jgi:hypothetical protein
MRTIKDKEEEQAKFKENKDLVRMYRKDGQEEPKDGVSNKYYTPEEAKTNMERGK